MKMTLLVSSWFVFVHADKDKTAETHSLAGIGATAEE